MFIPAKVIICSLLTLRHHYYAMPLLVVNALFVVLQVHAAEEGLVSRRHETVLLLPVLLSLVRITSNQLFYSELILAHKANFVMVFLGVTWHLDWAGCVVQTGSHCLSNLVALVGKNGGSSNNALPFFFSLSRLSNGKNAC